SKLNLRLDDPMILPKFSYNDSKECLYYQAFLRIEGQFTTQKNGLLYLNLTERLCNVKKGM
ncbi:MAG: hypothetical protein AAFZ35_21710, partial [Cyanobacteria bacterium J06649_12]